MTFDYIVVGTGFAGSTIAERIATVLGKRVLMIEQRNHVGGNAFDKFDEHGILVHQYGPHIFHTKVKQVWDYLSTFTEWIEYHHKVLGVIDGQSVPIPFNFKSLYQVFPKEFAARLERKLVDRYEYNTKIPILKLLEENDEELKFLANYVYEKIFLNYTVKQWGVKPEDMHPTVTGRVPVYLSRDDRYFQDRYQAIPKHGYTHMFQNMIFRSNIHVLLNTDYKSVVSVDIETGALSLFGKPFHGKLIYTGPMDYFFNYELGHLPYRSLRFDFENLRQENYQATGTVNYPNDFDFTRITEFKHLTHQKAASTTIVREYPQSYMEGVNVPYYPIKNEENHDLFRKYLTRAQTYDNILFVGRLAEYQYYDMDAVTAKALKVFEEKIQGSR